MKFKQFSLRLCVATAALADLCVCSATAATFTYNLLPPSNFGGLVLTGTIVTNCNNCALNNSNVISWSFNGSDGSSISSTDPGALVLDGAQASLVANPTSIVFSLAVAGSFTEFDDGGNTLLFHVATTFGEIEWDFHKGSIGDLDSDGTSIDTVVADATPLPAALPLFGTGLGGLGLLGWRRKRKQAA